MHPKKMNMSMDVDFLNHQPEPFERELVSRQLNKLRVFVPADTKLSVSIGKSDNQIWANLDVQSLTLSALIHTQAESLRPLLRRLEKELQAELKQWRANRLPTRTRNLRRSYRASA